MLKPDAARAYCETTWEAEILPVLHDYILIPNKSPAYDADWKAHGHMDRAVALLEGRNFVIPDDVKRIALPALRHRIGLAPDAMLEGRKPDDLLTGIIDSVAAPRV